MSESCQKSQADLCFPFFLQLASESLPKSVVWELWRETKCLLKILVFPPPSHSLLLSFSKSGTQAAQELLSGQLQALGNSDHGCLQAFLSPFPSHFCLRPQWWSAHLPAHPPLSNQPPEILVTQACLPPTRLLYIWNKIMPASRTAHPFSAATLGAPIHDCRLPAEIAALYLTSRPLILKWPHSDTRHLSQDKFHAAAPWA